MERAPINVTIVGGAGATARQLMPMLLASHLLAPGSWVRLVGQDGGQSSRALPGLASDWTDAHMESGVELIAATGADGPWGDVVVVVAGATMGPGMNSRDALADANLPLFRHYAGAIAAGAPPTTRVIVVTNPVELGVAVFADRLGPNRVLGMGTQSDTLRFRREIAAALGVDRASVGGWCAGEHGEGVVPIWSSVLVDGANGARLDRLARVAPADFGAEVARFHGSLMPLVTAGQIGEAFQAVEAMPVDVRAMLRPWVTHYTGARTPASTARGALDLLSAVAVPGTEVSAAAQLAEPWRGLDGVLGLPVRYDSGGRLCIVPLEPRDEEMAALRASSTLIKAKLDRWLGGSAP